MKRTRSNQSINIIQINICGGLHKKKTELAKLFKEERIHVAMLQEAHHKNVNYNITGYTAYPCNCKECLGIITYIRNDTIGDVSSKPIAHPTDVQEIIMWHAEKNTHCLTFTTPLDLNVSYQICRTQSIIELFWQEILMAIPPYGDIQTTTKLELLLRTSAVLQIFMCTRLQKQRRHYFIELT